MKCPKCHTEVDSDARFCPNCRERLGGKAAGGAGASADVPDAEEHPRLEKNASEGGFWGSALSSVLTSTDGKSVKVSEGEAGRYDGVDSSSRAFDSLDGEGNPFSDKSLDGKINGKLGRLDDASLDDKIDGKQGRLDDALLDDKIDGKLGKQEEAKSPIKMQNIVHEDRSACAYLKVEYNYNVLAISGFNSVIQLRLTPLNNTLRGLRLFWKFDDDKMKEKEVDDVLEVGTTIPINLSFRKERPGAYEGNFFFLCETTDGVQRFKFNELCPVYDSEERAKAGNFTFFIDNNATHAADIRNNAINIASQQQFTVNQLLDELRKMPQFGTKNLRVVKKQFEEEMDVVSPSNSNTVFNSNTVMDRVLLTIGGHNLFVLGKKSVKMGRSEQKNDLVVHIPGIPQNEKPNSTVSSCHGVMNIAGECVSFKDTSTFGSRISGQSNWFIKEERQLPVDCLTGLRLGNVKLQMAPCLCTRKTKEATCRGCQALDGNVSSVILKHIDNVSESYLIVPYCCDLGCVLPSVAGWTLFRKDGGFVIRTPDQQLHKLHPGLSLQYGEQTMEVKAFKQ
ncbi:MAG: zinc ribbon domain-containing protein [Lentisphaeria bacterium]|nr:zinc ribbon domain-containing protein [Lentisphaeria bacterium]